MPLSNDRAGRVRILSFLPIFLAAAFALTPATVSFAKDKDGAREIFEAPDGEARVYIFRKKKMTGASIKFKLFLNGHEIGKIGSGRYHTFTVAPGEHFLNISSVEDLGFVTFTAEPGEVFYFRVRAKVGMLTARGVVEFVEEQKAQKAIRKLDKGSDLYITDTVSR